MSYHPTVGKWMERDPVVYDDSMDLTEYVGSNPPNFTDPMGLKAKEAMRIANSRVYGQWFFSSLTAGPVVNQKMGAGNLAIENRNVRAWFMRRFVDLFLICDDADCAYWYWGSEGIEGGYKDSNGIDLNATVHVIAISANITIPDPWGYGKKLPIPGLNLPSVYSGPQPTWKGYNDGTPPTAYGILKDSLPVRPSITLTIVPVVACKNMTPMRPAPPAPKLK